MRRILSPLLLLLTLVSGMAKADSCVALLKNLNLTLEPSFITDGSPKALKMMLGNVEPLVDPKDPSKGNHLGVVVAGGVPENTATMQNYQYYWMRDGGITMTMLADIYLDSDSEQTKTLIMQKFIRYLEAIKKLQNQSNRSGQADVTYDQTGTVIDYFLNMGEPKFLLTLENFEQDWGRDQKDGPPFALKGILRVSRVLWENWDTIFAPGSPFKTTLTKADLYSSLGPTGSYEKVDSIVKRHLQYSLHNWRGWTVEMWEMMRGHHFATIGAHQAVLVQEGPDFATFVGDSGAGKEYASVGKSIDPVLLRFWDGRIIHATMNLDTGQFLDVKPEGPTDGLDAAFLIGAMHMKSNVFTAASDYIFSTVNAMEEGFESAYTLNQRGDDQLATLWGRYVKDSYDGLTVGSTGKGNPWFLTSYYVAEHAYKAAQEIRTNGHLAVTDLNVKFLNRVLRQSGSTTRVQSGAKLIAGNPVFDEIIGSFVKRGDKIMTRLENFRGPNGEMSEQIDRDAATDSPQYQRSLPNLTWSYAAYFRAIKARRNFMNSVTPGVSHLNVDTKKQGPDQTPKQTPNQALNQTPK